MLTDLKLPDVSGIEVLAASRAAQPRVPVVVLTGYGTVGTAVEAMKLGAYDFLEKPLEIDDLARLIERAIGERDEAARLPGSRGAADRRRPPAAARRDPPAAAGRAHGEHGAAHRRERHRQGALRPRDPRRSRRGRPGPSSP